MELYFLRHGVAVSRATPGYADSDRPLTNDGIAKMKQAARGIAKIVGRFDLIAASPLQRARSTAEIVVREMKHGSVILCDALLPAGRPEDLWSFLREHSKAGRILLVGHEPHLSRTVSLILGSTHPLLEFKKGGICRIDVENPPPRGNGTLIWHLTPKLLRQLAES